MGSLTDFPIDQVDSIGVDIEVNNLSDEHFRDVMEELTNHQIPERDKCPLVRRLNASISGYFKSTGDVGFSKMGPAKTNHTNTTTNSKPGSSSLAGDLSSSSGNNHHSSSSNHGVDNGNSIELIEYRRTFEYKNYHSPKSCSNPSDIKHKSSERTKGSIGVNSSSTTSATVHSHYPSSSSTANNNSTTISNSSSSSTSNSTQNGSNVDSFVNFDTLKRPPHELTELTSTEPTEGITLNDSNPPLQPTTTPSPLNIINVNASNLTNHLHNNNTIINNITNDTLSSINKDVNKDNTSTSNNKESKDNNGNNTNQTTNDTNNNAKGNRNGKEKKKKAKDKNLYKTVYTAQDIDGHIGDKSIDDLVYYVTGNKGEIVASSAAAASNQGVTVTTTSINSTTSNSGSGIASGNNSSTTTPGSGPVPVSDSFGVTSTSSSIVGGIIVSSNNIGASVQCGSSSCDNNKLATNSKSNKESGNVGGKVRKKEKPTATSATTTTTSSSSPSLVNNSTNQGRNKKGSNNINPSSITISTSTNNINLDNTSHATNSSGYCASNGNISDTNVKKLGSHVEKPTNCSSVNSGLGKSIPRSSSATTFDSKFSPSSSSSLSNVAQTEVNSSMDAPLTSPSLSKSHSIESSSSLTSMQQHRHQPVTKINTDPGITVSSKSKIKENHSIATTTTMINSNINKDSIVTNSDSLRSKKSDTFASSTHVATTANRDLDNYKELRYSASDPETGDQDSSFQPVKSKHLKRRKGVSRNKTVSVGGVGDLRMPSPSPRSSNTFFTTSNSSSSTSTIPSSVTSSTSNSVNISMTARGYESEREYCADEYRRRKDYLNHRKLASSMPHSEQNSADNSDLESSCSYPVSGRMPILPTPPGPPASSNNSVSSTPKVSYADIAKMGSVAVTPPVLITGNSGSMTNIKGPSPTNITLKSNNNDVKDANNNISTSSITGSTETSPKNASTVDSGLSLQTNLSSSSNPCSPCPSSSPNCISPSGFLPSSSSTTPSNQISTTLPEGFKSSKNHHNATTANNQIKSSSSSSSSLSPPSSSTESTLDATTLSKDNPPTIKSETNFDQENPSKNGRTMGTSNTNSTSQMLSAAVTIRPKDFDTSRETKMENQKVICEDNSTNSTKQAKNDKKMEKTTIQLTSTPSSSTTTTASTSSTVSPKQTSTTASIGASTIVAKSSGKSSSATNSKTLEALLSPPVEKTPTFDMKKENINKLNTRIASIKSDIPSRASMLKKSNSIPEANVKNNPSYRVNINESNNNTSKSLAIPKSPSSLPPVIMNDDSDGTDEIESTFTFGFFDDVASSSSSSFKNSPSTSSSSSSTIKPSTASAKPSSTTTTVNTTTSNSSNSGSKINKPANPVMMTSKSSSKPSTVKNNFDKTANNSNNNTNSSVSRVKSTKNSSNSNSNPSTVTSSSTPTTTNTTTATIRSISIGKTTSVKPEQSRSSSSEAATDSSSGKKNSMKDSKSGNNTSLDKFMAIKLTEPSTNFDADINTFNYSQIINFIKTAWESVMCQYHRSPEKTNSHSSSSTTQTSSAIGADLFCESTIYYKSGICEN